MRPSQPLVMAGRIMRKPRCAWPRAPFWRRMFSPTTDLLLFFVFFCLQLRYRDLYRVVCTLVHRFSHHDLSGDGGSLADADAWGELWTGSWWRESRAAAIADGFHGIVGVVLFVDETTATAHRMHQACPVAVSIGNIPLERRQCDWARELLGYLPTPMPRETKARFRARRIEAMRLLVQESIMPAIGQTVMWDGRRFCLQVALIAGDIKELWWQGGLKQSASAAFPCPWCEAPKDKLYEPQGNASVTYRDRTARRSDLFLAQGAGRRGYAFKPPLRALSRLQRFDVYRQSAPDPLHAASMGVLDAVLSDIWAALTPSQRGALERATAAVARFPGLHLPRDIGKHISKRSKPAYRTVSLCVVLPYVLRGLCFHEPASVLVVVMKHFALAQARELREDDLDRLMEYGRTALRLYASAHSNRNTGKAHMLLAATGGHRCEGHRFELSSRTCGSAVTCRMPFAALGCRSTLT